MEVVASGTWLYDGSVEMPVYVVRLDYDWYYELGVDDDDPFLADVPDLNAEGHLYYVRFRAMPSDGTFWPDSDGFKTIDEAKARAAEMVPSDIAWDSPSN